MGITAIRIPGINGRQSAPRKASVLPRMEVTQRARPYGLTSEEAFLEMLCLERRRSERSRKPFLLMLVDLGAEDAALRNGELSKVVTAVKSCTRETDITGWYKTGSTLGVIYTEIGDGEKKPVLEKLQAKVPSALRHHLAPKHVSQVELSFYLFPEKWENHKPSRRDSTTLYPDLSHKQESSRVGLLVKRAMDVVGSALALVLLSPVFLAIALAIKLTSKGPVFFRQERVGQFGVPFPCFKFRTMHTENDPSIHQEYVRRLIAGEIKEEPATNKQKVVYKITNDPRVTRVGRILRRLSLDEFPQFFNVLRGEMSLVGPRPPIPYELETYDVWHRRRVLEAKPGITGLWQVNGRSRTGFDDMVRLDLRYVQGWSLRLDLKILLQTPWAVLSGDGAH